MNRLRVIEKYNDGSGGLVEAPLAVETLGVRSARTASRGAEDEVFDLDADYLAQLVRNFGRKPGPVPIYYSHDTTPRRSQAGEAPLPAAGRIVNVWTEGAELWGRLDLGPKAWNLVVEERGFFGFSIEAAHAPSTATGTVEGWALVGGIFTNTPALNVQFAASAAEREETTMTPKQRLRAEVNRVREERNLSFDDARAIVKLSHPELYEKGMADYAPGRPRGTTPEDTKAVVEVLAEARTLVETRGVAFSVALDEVRRTKPELFARATAHYR
jgi:hypothetical protein